MGPFCAAPNRVGRSRFRPIHHSQPFSRCLQVYLHKSSRFDPICCSMVKGSLLSPFEKETSFFQQIRPADILSCQAGGNIVASTKMTGFPTTPNLFKLRTVALLNIPPVRGLRTS